MFPIPQYTGLTYMGGTISCRPIKIIFSSYCSSLLTSDWCDTRDYWVLLTTFQNFKTETWQICIHATRLIKHINCYQRSATICLAVGAGKYNFN